VLLYPVYTILLADHGLSDGQISSLFVLWAGASAILQIPAGTLADRTSRRRLLVVAAALRGLGFGLWVAVPSYPAFAAGFLLWSIKGALTGGTIDALVFEELAAVGRADRYTALTGRAATVSGAGILVATSLATPALAAGGYALVGYASVVVCAVQSLVALKFPEAPRVATSESEGFAAYLATLRSGISEVVRRPQLRRLVLVAGLGGLLAVDEYLPLLAKHAGVARSDIPLLLLLPTAATIVASALVGSGRWKALAAPLGVAALLIGGGARSGSIGGVVAMGLGIGAFQLGQLVVEARVQHAVEGPARSTVTSVVEMLGEMTALLVFAVFGLAAGWLGLPLLCEIDALLVFAVAVYAALTIDRDSDRIR
jgi:MFS family permease